MGRSRPRITRVVLALMVLAYPACSHQAAVEDLPDARQTLTEAGRRLSGRIGERELTEIARTGDRLLSLLNRTERDALSRGYLRFRVDRRAIVDVACPEKAAPFWLAEQGFVKTSETLNPAVGGRWRIFRKSVNAGTVGLGVNGLDLAATDHYVVFVRPAERGPLEVRGLDWTRWRTVAAADGVSASWDADLPLGRLPDSLRGATLLQPSQDLRPSTRLATGRVWKTHVPSSPAADQVAIAFGLDPAHSLTWTWRTGVGVDRTVVRLARVRTSDGEPGPGAPVRVLGGDSDVIETPAVLNDPAIRRHRVTAVGLEPDTSYAYALGDGSPSGWSPWRTVRTAPERPRSVKFLYLGDPQTGLESWGKLLRNATGRHPDADFLLIAGDLVDRGNERTNWDHFFLRAAGVFDRLPMLPCVGNHEYLDQGPRLYRAFFAPPANGPEGIEPGLVYSFEYGDAFVAVLDSNLAIYESEKARIQAEWLDGQLGRTRATWKFVMFHHPVYASHPSRENPALEKAWGAVFDKHHVDLVLQGHDHAYLRTYPMLGGRRVASASEGTVYVVSVSGDKYYDQSPRDYTEHGFTRCSTYQTIELRHPEGRLVYRAWDANGREVDGFEIRKRIQSTDEDRLTQMGHDGR